MNWQQACELPYYGGSDLGANPAAEETVFKLWAPTACGVVVCLYATGTEPTISTASTSRTAVCRRLWTPTHAAPVPTASAAWCWT